VCVCVCVAEALHLANLICATGYIFPIDDHILVVKNDGAYYRFQVACSCVELSLLSIILKPQTTASCHITSGCDVRLLLASDTEMCDVLVLVAMGVAHRSQALYGLRVGKIDPLHFQDGCRKRRLSHTLSVLSLSLGVFLSVLVVLLIRASFYVVLFYVFLCVCVLSVGCSC